ncbi:MAG: L-seryl-tRNA(Sec) selenium transferase, partial [Firmicutes bacterium]|nr:L-seryl-tRNA(Sec) selenium transferase [Bacillota bacterium]
RRQLPAVQRLMEAVQRQAPDLPRHWVHRGVAETLEAARRRLEAGGRLTEEALAAEAVGRARALDRPHLRPVINATGVLIHTNLGRSPLPADIMAHVAAVAAGYSTLEFDLEAGRRGSRHDHVAGLLAEVSGAEAALVVNNNAAAVLLALSTLAAGREVVVSRGQLVEIGGSFRVPEVMAQSGAILHEVGATNKTHLADYERGINERTALLLKVHTSNFRVLGFTAQVPTAQLVALARRHGLPVMEDLGSGVLLPLTLDGYTEPQVQEVVAAGVDVVTFSGDKLLGGPQAGAVVGRRDLIAAMKRHPLARAVRVDKMTLAALELVLRRYVEGRAEELPLWQMLHADPEGLRRRARRLAARIRGVTGAAARVGVVPDQSQVGGGSMPATRLPTWVVTVEPLAASAEAWEAALRAGEPPVIARVQHGALRFDPRTLLPGQDRQLPAVLAAAWAPWLTPGMADGDEHKV